MGTEQWRDQLEASRHGAGVCVCLLTQRLKVIDVNLVHRPVKNFSPWFIFLPFTQKEVSALYIFLSIIWISTSEIYVPNQISFICIVFNWRVHFKWKSVLFVFFAQSLVKLNFTHNCNFNSSPLFVFFLILTFPLRVFFHRMLVPFCCGYSAFLYFLYVSQSCVLPPLSAVWTYFSRSLSLSGCREPLQVRTWGPAPLDANPNAQSWRMKQNLW